MMNRRPPQYFKRKPAKPKSIVTTPRLDTTPKKVEGSALFIDDGGIETTMSFQCIHHRLTMLSRRPPQSLNQDPTKKSVQL